MNHDMEQLIDFLQEALGPDYEIVFYQIDNFGKGIISAFSQTRDLGLRIGKPMPQSIQAMWDEGKFLRQKTYTGLTTVYSNELVANTSMMYFDEQSAFGRGILCINYIENKMFDIIQELLYMSNLDRKLPMSTNLKDGLQNQEVISIVLDEAVKENTDDLYEKAEKQVYEVVRKHMGIYEKDESKFTPKIRRRIVEELYQKGVFNVKGIKTVTAKALFCAEVSIYRYLSYIRKND